MQVKTAKPEHLRMLIKSKKLAGEKKKGRSRIPYEVNTFFVDVVELNIEGIVTAEVMLSLRSQAQGARWQDATPAAHVHVRHPPASDHDDPSGFVPPCHEQPATDLMHFINCPFSMSLAVTW